MINPVADLSREIKKCKSRHGISISSERDGRLFSKQLSAVGLK
jgi:hypothetical protein